MNIKHVIMFKEVLRKHQLISFFFLTYLASWLLLLPYMLTGNEQAYGIFIIIAIFCPALVNILLSRIISPLRHDNYSSKRRITFLITWIIASVIFTFNVKTSSGIESPVAIVFYAIVSFLPALVLSSVFSRYTEVRKSLSSLLRPKGSTSWYIFAILVIPIIRIISLPLTRMLGLDPINEHSLNGSTVQIAVLVSVSFFYGLVFTGGLNEETGWTGFALPRLQGRFNPLISSMILWLFWILWHMPMQIAGLWNSNLDSFIRTLIGTFFARFIFTWLFNKTRGGILPAMLFHASANACFAFLPETHVHMALEAVLAIVIIWNGKMWKKLPESNPAVYQKELKTG
ncbi:MAG: CPBP family intramembrane metalloprotease [Bacteroidales bacterium]|nr:CPBP family intramembrane metalloprotease [Bacteroidales bacterium]